MLSHQLATIRRDVPVEVDVEAMKFSTLDTTEVRVFIENLHFYSLLKRLSGEKEGNEQKDKKKKKDKKNQTDSKQGEQLSIL